MTRMKPLLSKQNVGFLTDMKNGDCAADNTLLKNQFSSNVFHAWLILHKITTEYRESYLRPLFNTAKCTVEQLMIQLVVDARLANTLKMKA